MIHPDIRIVPPEGSRAIHWLGGRGTFLAVSEETAGAFGLWVDEPPPGGGPVPHVHTREEEFFYVLAGHFRYRCAGQTFEATPGALIGLPKGLGHRFQNVGSEPGRLLVAVVPAGNEGLFLELGNPLSEPHDVNVPPDAAKFAATAARYGVTIHQPTDLPEQADLPLGVGRAPILRNPGEGESFALAGFRFTFKVVAIQTLGAYTLTEVEAAPGASFASRHDRFSEAIYVLSGRWTVASEQGAQQAPAGSLIMVHPGTAHTISNQEDEPARALFLSVPGGIDDFYRAVGQPIFDRQRPLDHEPSDLARLATVGRLFGIEVLSPSLSGRSS